MRNRSLFFGDNLEILRDRFPGEEGYFDLIYLDPPFNSNRNYNVLFKEGLVESEAQTHAFEDSWHWTHETQYEFQHLVTNTTEPISNLMLALEKMIGHNDMLAYITMMATRLIELHRVLKPTGSLYLHCDPTASHYLKITLDAIFGKKNFRNELIWGYSRPSAPSQKQYSRVHDTIFWYTKTDKWYFNPELIRQPYAEKSLARAGYSGKASKMTKGGKVELSQAGKFPEDWIYIPPLKGNSGEFLGYPTQKPEKLLERIILGGSKKGDWILDPFCGCGTTVSVSERLERKWAGIDISMLAVKLIERRIIKQHPKLLHSIYTNGLPKDMGAAKALFEADPWDFEYWVAVHLLDARPPAGKSKGNMKGADKGIDGIITLITKVENGSTEYGKVIVQVKGGKVQRRDIATLKSDVARDKAIGGVFVTLQKPSAQMKEEAASAGTTRTELGEFPAMQILTVEELLRDMRPVLPGMVSPYKQALSFTPTVDQLSLLN